MVKTIVMPNALDNKAFSPKDRFVTVILNNIIFLGRDDIYDGNGRLAAKPWSKKNETSAVTCQFSRKSKNSLAVKIILNQGTQEPASCFQLPAIMVIKLLIIKTTVFSRKTVA